MTIETRPDYCLTPHLTAMLAYGCTRLEIGLQSTYEDVARDTNRGHTVAAVGECFQLAKDAGFKVGERRRGEGGSRGRMEGRGTGKRPGPLLREHGRGLAPARGVQPAVLPA